MNLQEDTERVDRATGIVSGRARADPPLKMQVWKLIAEFYVNANIRSDGCLLR